MAIKLHIGGVSEDMAYDGQIVPISEDFYYHFRCKARHTILDDPTSPRIEDREEERSIFIIFPDGAEKEIPVIESDVLTVYDSKSKTGEPILKTWSIRDIEDLILGKPVQVKKPAKKTQQDEPVTGEAIPEVPEVETPTNAQEQF